MRTAPGIQRASSEDRYEALFRVTKAIAECHDSDHMADTFTRRPREVIPLDYLQLAFDPESRTPACHLLEANGERSHCSSLAGSLGAGPIAWVQLWLEELKKACAATSQEPSQTRHFIVDLNNVTAIRKEGEEVLSDMMRQGAKFTSAGVLTKYLLKRLALKYRAKANGELNEDSSSN